MFDRLSRIASSARRQNLSALMCCRPVNVLACTGYWPVVGNSIAIVTREGQIGLLVPEDELELTRDIAMSTVRAFTPATLQDLAPVTERILRPLRELALSLGCAKGRFGHDVGACVEPATYAASFDFGASLPCILEAAVKASGLVDLSDCLATIRAVLDEGEIEMVRDACKAAAAGFQAAAGRITAGMPARRVSLILSDCISEGANRPRSGAFGFCMSGPNSAEAYRAYQMPGLRTLHEQDTALLHVNSFIEGYWTDITRTYSLGPVQPAVKRVQSAVLEATRAAIDAIRPGVAVCEVDTAARYVMDKAGYKEQFTHATGHGVGLAAIDHNARPRIHPRSNEVLERGMVFNVEPAAYFPGEFGVRQCNVVVVTETGCELLTDFDSSINELTLEEHR